MYFYLIPNFGKLTLEELKIAHVYEWLETVNISNKRINNVLGPLRQAFQEASTKNEHRVFHAPRADKPWSGGHFIKKRLWIPALYNAGVDYRNPYQTRHTFASMLLSDNKNPLWVAQQMGHMDWGMTRKVYGRWINEN